MTYLAYYKQIAKLGLPILIGQLGMIITAFADNIMVGHYSTIALASASFVNNVFNVAMFCLIGFTYGILPLVGLLNGDKRAIGSMMRLAVRVNLLFSLIIMGLMCTLYFCLDYLGQPPELLPTIRPYYLLTLASMLPVCLTNAFSQWSYGIKNTVMPMWIILAANVFNIIGNYALIFGHAGLPEMGLTGAGISTLISRVGAAAVLAGWFFFGRGNSEYRAGWRSGCSGRARKIWHISMPVSLQMTFESGSFSVAAIMAGWLGAVPLAAFQIIVIIGTLGFCLYYGVGSAVCVLVSNHAGEGDVPGMRKAGWAGYHAMLAVATCSTLIFIFFARPLMHAFTEDPAVLTAAMALLIPLALYQLGDATQVTFANALRGTSHVMPMLWIAFVSYIIIGIPATWVLAFPCGLGLYGIILSFSVSLFLAGALFLTFFLRATRRRSSAFRFGGMKNNA